MVRTPEEWRMLEWSTGIKPVCVQTAFCRRYPQDERSLKDPANQRMTLQVIEDNAVQLLRDDMIHVDRSRADLLNHLARVQALLVYLTARLFAGDIRARERGELVIPILYQWI